MFMGNTISIHIYHCLCTVESHCLSLSSCYKKLFYTNTYYHDVSTGECPFHFTIQSFIITYFKYIRFNI